MERRSESGWIGLIGLLVSTAATGCFGQASDPVPDWPQDEGPPLDEVLVDPETVEAVYDGSEVPSDEELGLGQSALTISQGLVGEDAHLVGPLRDGLRLANQMMRPGLLILHDIARNHPASEVSKDRVVWEVRRFQALHTLIIERDVQDAGQWNYALLVKPALVSEARARLLLSGFFKPRAKVDGRQTGSGLLRYEYDTFRALPGYGVQARGVGAVGFKVTPEGREFNIVLERFQGRADASPISARYHYVLRGDGSGRFGFVLKTDIFPQSEGRETLTEAAAWNPSRAGKARAHLTVLGLPDGLSIDECWDGQGKQLWVQWDPAIEGEESDGDEGDCEGPLAELELELDDLSAEPGEDPPIPD